MFPIRRSTWFVVLLVFVLVFALAFVGLRLFNAGVPADTISKAPPRFAGPAGAGNAGGNVVEPSGTSIPGGAPGPSADALVVPVSSDVDLRTLPQVGPATKHDLPEVEAGAPNWESRIESGMAAPSFLDPALQSSFGALAMPAASQNFKGLDFANFGAGHPPDTNGDVGPNNYIQLVNTSIGIFDKSGNRQVAITLDSFFSAAAAPCNNSNNGDPVVLYDAPDNRWLVSDFAWTNIQAGPHYECIAMSKTGDPVAGGWWLYTFRADDASHTWLNDYPKLGLWSDGIYMSSNMFNCLDSACSSASYMGVRVWALNRSDLISGAALRSKSFDMSNTNFGALLPGNYRGAPPPAGEPEFFASVDAPNAFHLWKFHVDWTTPANSTFTGPVDTSVASFSWPSANVPQPGTTNTLDTLGDRMMMQLQYRNLGGTEALWASHTAASGGVTGVRWYEFRNPNGATSVFQQGTYQPDSTWRWMPSLAVDQAGNMAIGYSVSSSSVFPGIRYAGRLVGDALGTLGQSELTLIAGGDSQTDTCGGAPCTRWGDYSAMTVDPLDDCTFWYTTEYYEAGGGPSGNWQTRIGAFKYPSCGVSGPTVTPTNTATVTTATPTITRTVTATSTPTIARTITATITNTPTVTATFTQGPSVTPTVTFTPSLSATPTVTPTITSTRTVTATPTISATPGACPNLSAGYCRSDTDARGYVVAVTNTGLTGDDQTVAISLPFSVTFFGTSFSTINVSSNGNAHFGSASTAYSNVAIPNTGLPNGMIAPFWDDLNLAAGGQVFSGVSGDAPNRVFTIEWRNVAHFSGTTDGASFEIQIDESSTATNHIWLLYQDTSFANASFDSGISATAGIENAAGSAGNQYSFNTAVLTNGKVVHFWPAPVAPTVTPTVTLTPTATSTPAPTATSTVTLTPTISATPGACPNLAAGYCRSDTDARSYVAAVTNTGLTGDDQTVSVSLPFSVTFFGTSFSTINVSSNGNAHFGTANTAYSNVAIPNTGLPNGLIAPFWDDLDPAAGGQVFTGVSGTAPNRVFVIEWRNVAHFGGTSDGASFEIQIDESSAGTNHIWLLYPDTSFANASFDSGISATAGIENAAGSAGNQYSFNSAVLTNGKVVHFWPQ